MKKHRFIVTVKGHISRQDAKIRILTAFALRQPDYCEFMVKPMPGPTIQEAREKAKAAIAMARKGQ